MFIANLLSLNQNARPKTIGSATPPSSSDDHPNLKAEQPLRSIADEPYNIIEIYIRAL
tara:strand:- start:62 stop:235 length:174 start_codon:yes stop_codon:yes gene_type:complete